MSSDDNISRINRSWPKIAPRLGGPQAHGLFATQFLSSHRVLLGLPSFAPSPKSFLPQRFILLASGAAPT